MDTDVAALAEHEYVLLTTFRRTGEPVGTPVWVVRDGERLIVTTGADSGKVKRLRHTPRVTLTPCDMRGRVKADAVPVEATAVIDDSAVTRERLDAALRAKYGMKYRMIRMTQRRGADSVALVITR
ncbi:PPOX class F420-dependent oxidoreductase [Microbacterium caowuchunii]|uniref:PPOX class F420-dependent oxidoreductase n=1 Tax=Microbacterium caowuchunii TaxID=2614638 RepID=A0A5N0TD27_9MICO|nr:PPOX class F420-dependent oxidoreductase [Microbacterium caowuchunii]KAA9131199.1 PPOX class F420-dependent oxidoreductase [Microbacterium caowuchunii]